MKFLLALCLLISFHTHASVTLTVTIEWKTDVDEVLQICENNLACATLTVNDCKLVSKLPDNFNDHKTQEALGKAYMKCINEYESNNEQN